MGRLTRRRLLAVGAAGLAGALSGCTEGPEPGSVSPSGGGGGSTPTPTPTPTANTTTTTPGPDLEYPDFAARTERVADGIEWHATGWKPTMRRVRTLSNQVTGYVQDLLESGSVTENDIAELETRTTAFAKYVRENVVPYYEVDDVLLEGNNVYVQQLKLASSRGDTEGQRQQLRRIDGLYRNYGQPSTVEEIFPNGPIHANLYDDLVASEKEAVFGVYHPDSGFVAAVNAGTDEDEKEDDTTEDDDPQHVHEFPSGHVVVAHSHTSKGAHNLDEHRNEPASRQVYAYRDGQIDVLEDTNLDVRRFRDFKPKLTDVFGPVSVPDRHEAMVYATVNAPTEDFVALPLQIQRFDSPRTAADAVEFLFSADVVDEGTEEIAGRTWQRIFYTLQGSNVYAFLIQTGAYVVTLFPETVPWGERVDWPGGPFERTWITA